MFECLGLHHVLDYDTGATLNDLVRLLRDRELDVICIAEAGVAAHGKVVMQDAIRNALCLIVYEAKHGSCRDSVVCELLKIEKELNKVIA